MKRQLWSQGFLVGEYLLSVMSSTSTEKRHLNYRAATMSPSITGVKLSYLKTHYVLTQQVNAGGPAHVH